MTNKRTLPEITLIATGVLAAVSIGAGIIAIFAHNWSDFPHGVRVFLSFVPVLIGLGVFSVAFMNHHDSRVWMEAASVFLALMVGSSISLVAQVYYMGGSYERFMFYWMLFCVPIIYIGRSTATAVFYIVGVTTWLYLAYSNSFGFIFGGHGSKYDVLWYWVYIGMIVPHFLIFIKPGQIGPRALLLGWVLGLSLVQTSFISFTEHRFINFMLLIVAMYCVGKTYYGNQKSFFYRPFQTIALYATAGILIGMTIHRAHEGVLMMDGYMGSMFNPEVWQGAGAPSMPLISFMSELTLIAFTLVIVFYLKKAISEKTDINYVQFAFPLAMIIGLFLAYYGWHETARIWSVLFVFTYCGWFVWKGILMNIPGIIAWGVFVTTALLVARYFDTHISFWLKGVLYIGIGAGVLYFNKFYSQKIEEWNRNEKG